MTKLKKTPVKDKLPKKQAAVHAIMADDLLDKNKKLPDWSNSRTLGYISTLGLIHESEVHKYVGLQKIDISRLVSMGLIRTMETEGKKFVSSADLNAFILSSTSECALAKFYEKNFNNPNFFQIVSNFIKHTVEDNLWPHYYASPKRGRTPVVVDFADFWKRVPRFAFFREIQVKLGNQMEEGLCSEHKSICSLIIAATNKVVDNPSFIREMKEAVEFRVDQGGVNNGVTHHTLLCNAYSHIPDFLIYGISPDDFVPLIIQSVKGLSSPRKTIHVDPIVNTIFNRRILLYGDMDLRQKDKKNVAGGDALDFVVSLPSTGNEYMDNAVESECAALEIINHVKATVDPHDYELMLDNLVKGETYGDMLLKYKQYGSITGLSNRVKLAISRINKVALDYQKEIQM